MHMNDKNKKMSTNNLALKKFFLFFTEMESNVCLNQVTIHI